MLKKKSVMALDLCRKESKNFYLFHNSYQQMNVMQTWRNFRVVRSFNCQCIPHFVFSSFSLTKASFGNFSPFMITTEQSLVALNGVLPSPVTMERFRPNVVVDGLKAYDEVCVPSHISCERN